MNNLLTCESGCRPIQSTGVSFRSTAKVLFIVIGIDCMAIIEETLQTDGNIVKQWGKENKMHINYTKTTCMVMGTRQGLLDLPVLNCSCIVVLRPQ